MRFTLTILVLILCFSACKEKAERKTESDKPKIEPIEKIDLSKIQCGLCG